MKVAVDSIRFVKIILVVTAVFIAVASLVVSHKLISDLQHDELHKMEIWTEAMRSLINADENADLNLVLKVINSNNNIPIVVLDKEGNVTTHRNLNLTSKNEEDSVHLLMEKSREMKTTAECMELEINAGLGEDVPSEKLYVYYQDSLMLKRLALYPYVQLGVVGLFVVVAIFALLSSKRAEQNKVWVGLSKETAHQLGTPISSLMAWTEILREVYPDDDMVKEMKNDVKRLEIIAERFSKIGSVPELKDDDLCEIVENVAVYINRRTSNKVKISREYSCDKALLLPICAPLVEWVVEVLCKNAIDAMSGVGSINVKVFDEASCRIVEITDTGKGIPRNMYKTVFKPGYTTKQRGWGLGLSLAKRIVEEYHHGRIFVKYSEIGKGTTFRIELRFKS